MDLTNARLIRGELRYGNFGFYCSNGRKHVFHHLFSEGSGTSMDIGPCEGDACPFAQTHGFHDCQSCESCLDSRRITLDTGRDLKVYLHPFGWKGRGKNRRRACSVTMSAGGGPLHPDWYYELAREAEATDGLTSSWPSDWLERKRTRECKTSDKGHDWSFEDDTGINMKHADGRYVLHRDSDNKVPDGAVQRECAHCHKTQMKRPDGRWSGDPDGCPCCEELPSEHSQYSCIRCRHGAPCSLVTEQERTYFLDRTRASASGNLIAMTIPSNVRRE